MRGRISALWEDYVVTRRTAFLIIGVMLVVALLFCSVSSYMIVEWRALFAARDPAQRLTAEQYFEARNRLFTTAVGLIGAVGLLGTLFFTWRNFLLAESGQITDRFAKAVELLGAVRDVGDGRVEPNIEARLGAIYALERIAQDSVRDHWQVMEVLAAHVRNAPAPPSGATDGRDLRPDVQAAIVVIGRRRRGARREGSKTLDLRSSHLEGREFSDGHFEGAYFADALLNAADLSMAYMGRARFKGANLAGSDLYQAQLEGADFDRANLEGAILASARIDGASLYNARMDGAILDDAVMDNVDLRDVQGLTQDQMDSTKTYRGAKNLPPHLKPDTRGEAQAPSSPEPTP